TVDVQTDFKAYPIVAGDESALREVLTNLLFNAVDAMPQGGRVLLETSIENERAVVRVVDTGTGMTETVRRRCLEPFFSTNGEQTARFIKQVNQNIPVILLTGFSGQIGAKGVKPAAVDVVLNKPITLDALRHTIRKLVHAT